MVEAKDARIWKLVSRPVQVEKLAGDFQFTEGPVWVGDAVLFSDIPADTIYRWDPSGRVSVFRKPSRNSNGLTLDARGHLICCEHGSRSVTRTEKDGSLTTLASQYAGKPLNSPNDADLFSDGTLYFTDPPYGIRPEQQEQKVQGVYRLWPDTGRLELLLSDFDRPNGIAFSPDYRTLYVTDSSSRSHIRSFRVTESGKLLDGKIFATLRDRREGIPDGLKVDRQGNVWSTGPGGIWVFDPDGTHLGTILTPEVPANCAWGGKDGRDLYVTARTGLYRIRTLVGGFLPGQPR
ncbi:MAG: gluconolactonase [Armatimonadota bacterium]|nr:MAG: gluconolactonase [Armatimonadota bacterium]